jgi:hypothetical protein
VIYHDDAGVDIPISHLPEIGHALKPLGAIVANVVVADFELAILAHNSWGLVAVLQFHPQHVGIPAAQHDFAGCQQYRKVLRAGQEFNLRVRLPWLSSNERHVKAPTSDFRLGFACEDGTLGLFFSTGVCWVWRG